MRDPKTAVEAIHNDMRLRAIAMSAAVEARRGFRGEINPHTAERDAMDIALAAAALAISHVIDKDYLLRELRAENAHLRKMSEQIITLKPPTIPPHLVDLLKLTEQATKEAVGIAEDVEAVALLVGGSGDGRLVRLPLDEAIIGDLPPISADIPPNPTEIEMTTTVYDIVKLGPFRYGKPRDWSELRFYTRLRELAEIGTKDAARRRGWHG